MTCSKCGADKSEDQFTRKLRSSNGKELGSRARPVSSWCRQCCIINRKNVVRQRRKEGRCYCGRIPRVGKKTCSKCASSGVGRLKALNQTEFKQLLSAQHNQCLICADEHPSKWCLDHDHKTGKIRAILCHHCNLTLGLAKENIFRLQRCLAFLRFHTQKIRHSSGTLLDGIYPQGGLLPEELRQVIHRWGESSTEAQVTPNIDEVF